MTNPIVMQQAAEAYLGTPVLGAGIFGLKDDYGLITGVGAAAAVATDVIPGGSGPVAAGVASGLAVHAAREIHAEQEGLDVRMLVAVTADSIHVLKWDAGSQTVVASFRTYPKNTTRVSVSKFGAARNLVFEDPETGDKLALVGSTGFLSSEAQGDKTVFSLLG